MEEIKAPIEIYMEQVTDGSRYKGNLKIGGVTLDFDIVFTPPIEELDKTELSRDEAEMRRHFLITMRRDGVDIELDSDEFYLFFLMIAMHAVEFYNNPYIRDSNRGRLGTLLRGGGVMKEIEGVMTLGTTSKSQMNASSETAQILSRPKFGCMFVQV